MKKKPVTKSRPGTVTIRIDNTDFARLGRLRAFLGGGSASSALKYALKAADEQRRLFQTVPLATRPVTEYTHRPCAVARCEKMAAPGCFSCSDHNEEHG